MIRIIVGVHYEFMVARAARLLMNLIEPTRLRNYNLQYTTIKYGIVVLHAVSMAALLCCLTVPVQCVHSIFFGWLCDCQRK